MDEHVSEIARVRERIMLESQASWWALHGLASGNAQHEFITARFKNMEEYHGRLTTLVGEEAATECLCEAFEGGKDARAS